MLRPARPGRRARTGVALLGVLALSSGLVAGTVSTAGADNLSNLRAQAAQLAARIQVLGQQEEVIAERYDGARYTLASVEARVAAAKAAVGAAEASAGADRRVLENEAIDAYESDGSTNIGAASASNTITSATDSLLQAEYQQSLASSQADNIDRYRLASLEANTAELNLRVAEAAAAANVRTIANDATQTREAQAQLETAEAQDNGQIAAIVAADQAAAAAAAQRAAQQRLIQEQQSAAAQAAAAAAAASGSAGSTSGSSGASGSTSGSSGGSGSGGSFTPPPSSSAAAVAVAAAESRLGDPYVWAAAGPGEFDCSGLVMWSYAQAGISLPHFSGAQYADTTHIPMSDLEPGDLVFPADPGEHVAMYIGNGDIIEAPYTGAFVHIVPMSSWFVYASRVA